MASTITRDTWTNDTGTAANPNGDGTILNNSVLQDHIYARIDAMFAGAGAYATFVFGGKVSATTFYVNETANSFMTNGLTINQGANDDEILCLKSSDVVQDATNVAEADTFFSILKFSATAGGAQVRGFSEDGVGLALTGGAGATDTTKTSSARGQLVLNAVLHSAGNYNPVGSNANMIVMRDDGTTRWIIDAEGDTYRAGTDNTFDTHDDAMLALAWEHAMNPSERVTQLFNQYCQYHAEDLEQAGILCPVDPKTGGRFYGESALLRLNTGAVWQLAIQLREQARQIEAVQAQLAQVQKAT